VSNGSPKQPKIIFQKTDPGVARMANQLSEFPGSMTVIEYELSPLTADVASSLLFLSLLDNVLTGPGSISPLLGVKPHPQLASPFPFGSLTTPVIPSSVVLP
jgi:hypothetical protein